MLHEGFRLSGVGRSNSFILVVSCFCFLLPFVFMMFRLLHYFIVVTVYIALAMFSSLSYFLVVITRICSTQAKDLLEIISLPPRGTDNVCAHSTLPKPH